LQVEGKRYQRDVSAYDTVFGSARFTVSPALTWSDLGKQHKVWTGSRNSTLNRKY